MQKRVYFTGASGKAGQHVAAYLAKKGHKVLNADVGCGCIEIYVLPDV